MNSYDKLLGGVRYVPEKESIGFRTVAGAYRRTEILSACKDEISSVQKGWKSNRTHSDRIKRDSRKAAGNHYCNERYGTAPESDDYEQSESGCFPAGQFFLNPWQHL